MLSQTEYIRKDSPTHIRVILGAYSAAVVANRKYGLSEDEALDLMILDLTASDFLDQAFAWYENTRSLASPLYFAIYVRNYK